VGSVAEGAHLQAEEIEVRINSPKVKFIDNNRATVTSGRTSLPDAESDQHQDADDGQGGDRWLIQQERASN